MVVYAATVPDNTDNSGQVDVSEGDSIRRTVSSKLRTTLPRATVAALMGHLEETNENHYNYDVTNIEIKKMALSSLWSNLENVTECNPIIKEFSETKNKQETAKIVPFPA